MEDALAYLAITRLQSEYADVTSRRAFDEFDDLFTAYSTVHLDLVTAPARDLAGRGELGPLICQLLERFEFFEFVTLNHVVRVKDENNATGRVYMCELRQDLASGGWSNVFGVYHDTYERDTGDGRWRYAKRSYQSLARTGRAEVFRFPSGFSGPLEGLG